MLTSEIPAACRVLATVAALLVLESASAEAQNTSDRRVLKATPRLQSIRIDARLDESDWQRSEVASDFVQRAPNPNAPASQRTEVRVLVDDDALYVGARMNDTRPSAIAAQLGRRDPGGLYTDAFHVVIDSYFDRRTAFRFSVTPAGVQGDAIHFNDVDDDENWDAVFESAAAMDSGGWTAEMRIPLSQLRYGRVRDGTLRRWGIQFGREIARAGETSVWSPMPPTVSGMVSLFGDLVGIDSIGIPARLELLPYVSSQVTRLPGGETNPLVDATTASARAGLDVRYGLPRGLTLTATINPDFGQVEVDPAVVNLTAFETFFSERRPFFLEGNEIFRLGGTVSLNDNDPPRPFYSRRIGRAPRGRVDDDAARYVDAPSQTDIIGAGKISGKTPGGWSLGVLGAVTEEVRARYQTDAGSVLRAPVEPRGAYGVARVARDLRDGNTILGVALTGAGRDMSAAFAPILPKSAYTAGVSAQHAWDDRTWTASGYFSRSMVDGDPAFIGALQRSNTHVFQRPDRETPRFDASRSSLDGHFYALSLAKTGGRHWLGSLTYEETGPGYDVNELGFQRRSDLRALGTSLRYRQTSPGPLFRNWLAFVDVTNETNVDGDLIDRRYALVADAEWNNFWSSNVVLRWNPQTYDDRLTRGGPLALKVATRGITLSISTDNRRPVAFDAEYQYEGSASNEWRHSWEAEIEVRPSSAVEFSIGPEFTRQYDYDQFVTAVSDAVATRTFGRRYVFGDIEQHELSIDTRVSWTFSPKLSLQVFAQPFVTSGRFDRYKEFRAPKTFDFDVYGRDRGTITRDPATEQVRVDPDGAGPAPAFQFSERDFTVRALRGNAVLRWEYRPGSALFLVWQRVGEDERATANLAIAQRPSEAFQVDTRNVFLVKASYWFGR